MPCYTLQYLSHRRPLCFFACLFFRRQNPDSWFLSCSHTVGCVLFCVYICCAWQNLPTIALTHVNKTAKYFIILFKKIVPFSLVQLKPPTYGFMYPSNQLRLPNYTVEENTTTNEKYQVKDVKILECNNHAEIAFYIYYVQELSLSMNISTFRQQI